MLQLRELNRRALSELTRQAPLPRAALGGAELESLTDRLVTELRDTRHRLARRHGPATWLRERFDRTLRTPALERLDRDDVSDQRKVGIVEALHGLNDLICSYDRFLGAMEPMVRRINREQGRPARVLELATGAGEFSLRCPEAAQRRGLAIEITGSDIVPAYVEKANAEAARRRVDVRFEVRNAFALDVPRGRYDLCFIGQSMHHFSAGQLALMMAQARRVCTTGFVGVDGLRSLLLLSTIPAYSLLFGSPNRLDFAHDALLSTRKFFSEPELELIARVAVPDGRATVRSSHPGYTVIHVDFEGAA